MGEVLRYHDVEERIAAILHAPAWIRERGGPRTVPPLPSGGPEGTP